MSDQAISLVDIEHLRKIGGRMNQQIEELRNHFYHELGTTKLACLWVLEHFGKIDKESSDR